MRRGPFRRSLRALLLAAATVLLFLVRASALFDPSYNPHAHFRTEGMCPKCHVYSGGSPDPERFTGGSTDYCYTCHTKESLGNSHPNRVRPRDRYPDMRVPEEYMLDDDGRMMCLTCHNAHGLFVSTVKSFKSQNPENPDRLSGTPFYYRTFFLRRSDPVKGWAVLCDGCHQRL